jgi:hypothetical protein
LYCCGHSCEETCNVQESSKDADWLVVGDFNLMRKHEDRNKLGGNLREMMEFNAAISNQRLEELRLHGAKYTWTNKQLSPLLERLDWFLASVSWMTILCEYLIKRHTRSHTLPHLHIYRYTQRQSLSL